MTFRNRVALLFEIRWHFVSNIGWSTMLVDNLLVYALLIFLKVWVYNSKNNYLKGYGSTLEDHGSSKMVRRGSEQDYRYFLLIFGTLIWKLFVFFPGQSLHRFVSRNMDTCVFQDKVSLWNVLHKPKLYGSRFLWSRSGFSVFFRRPGSNFSDLCCHVDRLKIYGFSGVG